MRQALKVVVKKIEGTVHQIIELATRIIPAPNIELEDQVERFFKKLTKNLFGVDTTDPIKISAKVNTLYQFILKNECNGKKT